jgi:hypothetical protein
MFKTMKSHRWLLLGSGVFWAITLGFIGFKLNHPFGSVFQGTFWLFLFLTALLLWMLGRFLIKKRLMMLKILSVLPFLFSLIISIVTLIGMIDYRLLLPGISSKPTPESWAADYQTLKVRLRLHPAFKDSLSDSLFDETKPDFNTLSNDHSLVVLMKLAGKLSDGHTFVHPLQPAISARYFPLTGYWFKEGYFITRTSAEYSVLKGRQVVGLNGIRVEDLLVKINELTGPENCWQGLSQFDQFVFSSNVLHGLNIIDNNEECIVNYLADDGKVRNAVIKSESFLNWFFWALKPVHASEFSPALMNLRKPNYTIHFDSLQRTLLLSLHLIQPTRKFSINQLSRQLTLSLQKNPEKLVVDLRNSLGGNNQLYAPIINAIKNDTPPKIYVFTSRKTFSASVNFISELQRAVPIILVGEPTGAGPNHYGDAEHTFLPSTGISVFISTRKWIFDSLNSKRSYEPDIYVPNSFKDFQQSIDACLKVIE